MRARGVQANEEARLRRPVSCPTLSDEEASPEDIQESSTTGRYLPTPRECILRRIQFLSMLSLDSPSRQPSASSLTRESWSSPAHVYPLQMEGNITSRARKSTSAMQRRQWRLATVMARNRRTEKSAPNRPLMFCMSPTRSYILLKCRPRSPCSMSTSCASLSLFPTK